MLKRPLFEENHFQTLNRGSTRWHCLGIKNLRFVKLFSVYIILGEEFMRMLNFPGSLEERGMTEYMNSLDAEKDKDTDVGDLKMYDLPWSDKIPFAAPKWFSLVPFLPSYSNKPMSHHIRSLRHCRKRKPDNTALTSVNGKVWLVAEYITWRMLFLSVPENEKKQSGHSIGYETKHVTIVYELYTRSRRY